MIRKLIILIPLVLFLEKHTVLPQVAYTIYNPLNTNDKLGSDDVYAIALDPNDDGKTIWFGCRANNTWGWPGGLSKFDTENEEWTLFTQDNSSLPVNRIWDIEFDSKGNMWIATHGGGLAKFVPPYGINDWTIYNESNGLGYNNIYDIAIDENDILWLGHGAPAPDGNSTAALTIFDGDNQWQVITPANSSLKENSCYAITFGHDGIKWLGQKNEGVFQFNDNGTPFDLSDDTWSQFTTDNGLGGEVINAGSADTNINGDIWFGHSRSSNANDFCGCSRYDGSSWINYLNESEYARIRSIVHDSKGNVWLGDKGGVDYGSTGLWKFDGTSMENVFVDVDAFHAINYINKIAIDEKKLVIWLGTSLGADYTRGGVVKIEGLITPVSVKEEQTTVPSYLNLSQNYPNPFNPETFIQYSLGKPQHIKLAIYNLNGQLIRILENGDKLAGTYTVRWDGRAENGDMVGSGVYLYQIETDGGYQAIKKAILLK